MLAHAKGWQWSADSLSSRLSVVSGVDYIRKYHARLLTPQECARLMGADAFQVSGSLNEALFGFGDAVCVPAITWLAEHVLPIRAAAAQPIERSRAAV